jgi:hypothetical protein
MTEPNWTKNGFFAELSEFKSFLQQACGASMYAIAVKGLAFPNDMVVPPIFDGQVTDQPRAVLMKTSSWAMANCFLIEKALGHHRADWYIDSRITTGADLPKPFASEATALLPKSEPRRIDIFKGSIRCDG